MSMKGIRLFHTFATHSATGADTISANNTHSLFPKLLSGSSSAIGTWLRQLASTPPSFLDLTRNQIRRSIDKSLFQRPDNVKIALEALRQSEKVDALKNDETFQALTTASSIASSMKSSTPAMNRISEENPLQFLPLKIRNYIFFHWVILPRTKAWKLGSNPSFLWTFYLLNIVIK